MRAFAVYLVGLEVRALTPIPERVRVLSQVACFLT